MIFTNSICKQRIELGPGRGHRWGKEKPAKLLVVVWDSSVSLEMRDLKHMTGVQSGIFAEARVR